MKKLFSLICLALFASAAMSQQLGNLPTRISTNKANMVMPSPVISNPNPYGIQKREVGDQHSVWINFPSILADNLSQTFQTYVSPLFPDTFVWIRYVSVEPNPAPHYVFTYSNNHWCSVGLTMNPRSDYIGLTNLYNRTAYTVDSVAFFYGYYRFSDASVTDTLIVNVLKPKNLLGYTWTSSHKPAFAVPRFDRANCKAKNADFEQKITLGPNDTFTFKGGKWGIKTLKIMDGSNPFKIDSGGPCAITWSFKSGVKNYMWDTIPYAKWDSVQGVQNPLNVWFWAEYVDQAKTEIDEFNNGNLINQQQRYSDFNTNFAGTYLPGALWSYPAYPIALFKITYTEEEAPSLIQSLTNDIRVKIYPNPVAATSNINVNLTLEKNRMVTVSLFDMLGHKVATLADGYMTMGDHNFTYSTSNLKSGVYVCKIESGNTTSSYKINVR